MKTLHDCQLYTFIDTAYLAQRSMETVARQLCDGGSDLIQLRAKHASREEVRQWAERILPITEQAGVGLVINDHWPVALAIGAPFCHLGQEDFFDAGYSQVTQLFPADAKTQLGLSSHAPAQAERAVRAGAAYLGIGPVFATPTKATAQPVTLEYVRWAAQHLTVPWFAIGGITLTNLEQVLSAGARRICVVSAILNSSNIVKTCQEFNDRLKQVRIHQTQPAATPATRTAQAAVSLANLQTGQSSLAGGSGKLRPH